MGETSIEWTDATWNPTRGCDKISPGCKHCYAETFAERWRGIPGHPYEQGFDLRLAPSKLDDPLGWRKPRRIFVNSMSDLFHNDVPNEYIAAVFGVMAACPQHTFQVLTKRAERMRAWFEWVNRNDMPAGELHDGLCRALAGSGDWDLGDRICERLLDEANAWPLRNVWLGVSVEDQEYADRRIPHLLSTAAAVRFVSAEPLLGSLDLSPYLTRPHQACNGCTPDGALCGGHPFGNAIDWLIVGGESGTGARPFDLEWARVLLGQCVITGVPCFFKQAGAAPEDGAGRLRLLDRKGGRLAELPEELRVRQFPEVRT
jgi:protein gp37